MRCQSAVVFGPGTDCPDAASRAIEYAPPSAEGCLLVLAVCRVCAMALTKFYTPQRCALLGGAP